MAGRRWGRIPTNPGGLVQVPGTAIRISRLDLLRTGEMLEAERELGTRATATLFQPGGFGGEYTWGVHGAGDVRLPAWNGRPVDIDWLNTLVDSGVVDEATYVVAKVAWTLADGTRTLVTSRSTGGFRGHWNAICSPEELEAVALSRAIVVGRRQFRQILHPQLVTLAEDFLRQWRAGAGRARGTGAGTGTGTGAGTGAGTGPGRQPPEPAPRPEAGDVHIEPADVARPRIRIAVRSTGPGLPGAPGSLQWMAQGLSGPPTRPPPPTWLRRGQGAIAGAGVATPPPATRWSALGGSAWPTTAPPGSLGHLAQGLGAGRGPGVGGWPSRGLGTGSAIGPGAPRGTGSGAFRGTSSSGAAPAVGSLAWMGQGLGGSRPADAPPGSLRWMAQGLPFVRTTGGLSAGSLAWMAQGLREPRPPVGAPGSLRWMAQGLR